MSDAGLNQKPVRDWLLQLIKFLPFELPSRKAPAHVFLAKSVPYVVAGLLLLSAVIFPFPAHRYMIEAWHGSLLALPNFFDWFVNWVLTIVLVWTTSYAIGALVIEVGRRPYRIYLARPLEKKAKELFCGTAAKCP